MKNEILTPEQELLHLTRDNNKKLEAIRKNTSIITSIIVIAVIVSVLAIAYILNFQSK